MNMNDILTVFDIVFSDSVASYREGDEVSGEVVVDLKEDIVVEMLLLDFSGTAAVRWLKASRPRGTRSPDGREGYEEEKCLNQRLEISLQSRENSNTKEYMVGTGRHTYPFSIQLPYDIPSTFIGDHGVIKYTATANLVRPFQSRQTTVKEFTVTSTLDLYSVPQALQPIQCQKVQAQGIKCCLGGTIEAVWRLDRIGYIPGEIIGINGEIHNNSRIKVKKSKVMLIQLRVLPVGVGKKIETSADIIIGTVARGAHDANFAAFHLSAPDTQHSRPPGGASPGQTVALDLNYFI